MWIILFLIVRSSQDLLPVIRELKVSDEVCGYLRHIKSGTCVEADNDQRLIATSIAEKTFPCSENNFFCYNTSSSSVRIRKGNEAGDFVATDRNHGEGEKYLELCSDPKSKAKDSRWRLLDNGRIERIRQLDESGCWKRSPNSSHVLLASCRSVIGNLTELEQQQFDFQSRQETKNSDNHSLLHGRYECLKVHIKEKDHGEMRPRFRFYINLDFFEGSEPNHSLLALKLHGHNFKKGRLKEMSLSAVNWKIAERCSDRENLVEIGAEEKVESNLIVWINHEGELNVILEGKRVALKCLVGPWSDPMKIKVSGVDMRRWNATRETKFEDIFNIRYEIDNFMSKF